MNTQITEQEAIEFAGVSAGTLKRFAEAGYLEVDDPESPTYIKSEICALFGIPEDKPVPESNLVEIDFKDKDGEQELVDLDVDQDEVHGQGPLLSQSTSATNLRQGSGGQEDQDQDQDQENLALKPDLASGKDPDDYELKKSKKVIELQEQILQMKDDELEELRKERDWLKDRIQKLEEKADRDQLLMLSEMQTVREILVMQQHQRNKTPLRAALEWIGLIDPEPINLKAPAIELPEGRFKSELIEED
ncbi:MAG: hypothetical protein R3A13_09435 [Bdellovibrionota bacterium]